VSGGADSMALLWCMYMLRDKLGIHLQAAHFNHHLRGEESDRDEAFVRSFCDRFEIPLILGGGQVEAGKKGLEAAAREARYRFLESIPGKLATAHTADDNAETVLMHLVRGTGLKGLGGIAPVRGRILRPMLTVTRQQVVAFLQEYCLSWVEDSSNAEDDFLRNRLRHSVMPLLKEENPRLAEKLSSMALRLREDEAALEVVPEKPGEPPEPPHIPRIGQPSPCRPSPP
jgi:tRNA(Ile)-lysidine synthase